jgi:DNA-binding transcriptional regulator YhcF (GntR family)
MASTLLPTGSGERLGGVITVDHDSPVPPYEQVREQVRAQVESGELAPGTRLPTVRGLAGDLGLAANTVARAYRELEALGLIETRGRAGSVVSGDGVEQAARQAAREYAERARALGIDRDVALDLARRALG